MALEGVVDALRKVHGSLRPDGLMLDVRPVPLKWEVETLADGASVAIGRLGEPGFGSDTRIVEDALTAVVASGHFVTEREKSFEVGQHCDGIEDFREFLDNRKGTIGPQPQMLRRAGVLLADGRGEVVVKRPMRATLLRRTEPAPGTEWPQLSRARILLARATSGLARLLRRRGLLPRR